MSNISKGRAWIIATIVVVACLVAIGLSLGLGLRNKSKDVETNDQQKEVTTCSAPPSSSRLTPDSPIYSPLTDSLEGFYRFGAVASDSPPCSTIGTEIMIRHGGSATDAAIAALVCAAVYNPQSSGIGGGFMMTYYKGESVSNHVIVAREMAPMASTENMYKQTGWSSLEGAKAVAVPGEVKGLYEAWKLGGKLPWKSLFQPSIKMCMDGFTVGPKLAIDIEDNKEYYDNHPELKLMVTNPTTGNFYMTGDHIKLPKLGATLDKIAADPLSFYNGSLAEDIIKDLNDTRGIITSEDLEMYQAEVKDDLTIELSNGYTVMSPPPPSSGGIVLFILNILDGYNFNESSISSVSNTVETYHRVIEAFKHGFSVRTQFGDPDVESQEFRNNLDEVRFGSKIVGSRTGIIFNDEMDDFSTPNTTNFFGFPASEANFIKPRKRPLSSMSPNIVINTTSGDVRLVVGAAGGSRIISSTAFITLETLLLKLGVKEAIDFPRIHHQLIPDEVRITDRFQQALQDGLEERGHKFTVLSPGSAVQAVLQKEQGQIFANCDHSKYGVPDGV